MFILFESGGGEMFLIDCDERSTTYRHIFIHTLFDVDYGVLTGCYDSLESMLETILQCYKEGVFYYNESELFFSNFSKEIQISREYNPKSEKWTRYL